VITNTETACPNKECQSEVDKINKEIEDLAKSKEEEVMKI